MKGLVIFIICFALSIEKSNTESAQVWKLPERSGLHAAKTEWKLVEVEDKQNMMENDNDGKMDYHHGRCACPVIPAFCGCK